MGGSCLAQFLDRSAVALWCLRNQMVVMLVRLLKMMWFAICILVSGLAPGNAFAAIMVRVQLSHETMNVSVDGGHCYLACINGPARLPHSTRHLHALFS